VDFMEKWIFLQALRLYNSACKICSIYWFYDIYKGFMGLYLNLEVSLNMLVVNRTRHLKYEHPPQSRTSD
jgi:hypothetical protein